MVNKKEEERDDKGKTHVVETNRTWRHFDLCEHINKEKNMILISLFFSNFNLVLYFQID